MFEHLLVPLDFTTVHKKLVHWSSPLEKDNLNGKLN